MAKKHDTDKHAKGVNSWSHMVSMIFSKFFGSVSLRQISEGGQSAIGNLKNLDLSRAPSKSNISDIRMLRGALNSLETFLCPSAIFRTAWRSKSADVFEVKNRTLGFNPYT